MNERTQTISDLFKDFAALKHAMVKEFAGFKPPVPPAQKEVLFMLAHNDGISLKELAEHLDITPGAATQLTEALVKSGLVSRKDDTVDRRVVHLHLSADGRKLMQKLSKARIELSRRMFDDLSDEEIASFHSVIKKMYYNLEKPSDKK